MMLEIIVKTINGTYAIAMDTSWSIATLLSMYDLPVGIMFDILIPLLER